MEQQIKTLFENNKLSVKRILIIDDDEAVRKALIKMLNGLKFQILEAEDGEKGLKMHNKEHFHLIITDMIMPCKEGIQVIKELRRNHPEVPVIAISGGGEGSSMDYLKWAKILGARACLNKPVQKEELRSAVLANL